MLNDLRVFEELVFFCLWILDSGLLFPVPDSGFRILWLPVETQVAGKCFHRILNFSQTFTGVSIARQKHGENRKHCGGSVLLCL